MMEASAAGVPATDGWLLAAEADRVQDLVFRSSRLREVVAGSALLEEFWKEAAALAEDRYGPCEIVVRAGGALRVLFSARNGSQEEDGSGDGGARKRALGFGRELADRYAIRFGSRITVTPPVPCEPGVGERLAVHLRTEKARGDLPAVPVAFPYMRPCTSCGREPAEERTPGGEGEHLCRFCAERRDPDLYEGLKDRFVQAVDDAWDAESSAFPGPRELPKEPTMAVGSHESPTGVGSVAYLLADGNRFGQRVFSGFEMSDPGGREALSAVSRAVSESGERALAEATATLVRERRDERLSHLPVLPLITGGDDVFALLPAPWAFWFLKRFVEAFERKVLEAMWGRSSPDTDTPAAEGPDPPTVSCVVVFCKAKFPYRIAHELGEHALREVKSLVPSHPGVSLVRGLEVRATSTSTAQGPPGEYGVFQVGSADSDPSLLSVDAVMDARRELRALPGKRRQELAELFGAGDRESDKWEARARKLVERIATTEPTLASLGDALSSLVPEPAATGAAGGGWLATSPLRRGRPGASGVVDLLHFWDYLLSPSDEDSHGV